MFQLTGVVCDGRCVGLWGEGIVSGYCYLSAVWGLHSATREALGKDTRDMFC